MSWDIRECSRGYQVLRDGMIVIFPVTIIAGEVRLAMGMQLPDHIEMRDIFETREEAEAILAKMQEVGKHRATLNQGSQERS